MATTEIHLAIDGTSQSFSTPISTSHSTREVHRAIRKAAGAAIPDDPVVLKLYSQTGTLVPIGPHIPANTADKPYRLVTKAAKYSDRGTGTNGAIWDILESSSAVASLVKDVDEMSKSIRTVSFKVEQIEKYTTQKERVSQKPSTRRVHRALQQLQLPVKPIDHQMSREIYEQMKKPTFDIWLFRESELIHLLAQMYEEFGLIKTFNISIEKLHSFLHMIKHMYNKNPFHNFQHCFCVSQMMFALLHVTGVHKHFTPLEKLALITAAIGHDLDHPGFNNAYQVNACTELATTYNDISPLENHHSAVLFSILHHPDTNILSGLSTADYKEVRKIIIMCILATDMAKHGEILGKFKSITETFSYEDVTHRHSLFQMLIKCSDISNEVRPKHVSEPWVDNLLEEFFGQSDREKAEGLPTAPFMDRDKVTKPSAQVGFIGFVMIPLFELASKVLPDMEDQIIQPIRKAHEYYKSLLEKK
eukprot:jgi/Hompol1/3629/HPOL_003309-RA